MPYRREEGLVGVVRQTDGCTGAVRDALRYPSSPTGERPSGQMGCRRAAPMAGPEGRPGRTQRGRASKPRTHPSPNSSPSCVCHRPAHWGAGRRPARHSPRSWRFFPTLAGCSAWPGRRLTERHHRHHPRSRQLRTASSVLEAERPRRRRISRYPRDPTHQRADAPTPSLTSRSKALLRRAEPTGRSAGRGLALAVGLPASDRTKGVLGEPPDVVPDRRASGRMTATGVRALCGGAAGGFPTTGRSAGRDAAVLGTHPGACVDQPSWTAVSSMGTAIASTTTFPIVICLLSAAAPG